MCAAALNAEVMTLNFALSMHGLDFILLHLHDPFQSRKSGYTIVYSLYT